MGFEWLIFLCLPVLGHVLYGIPPDPEDAGEPRVTLHNGDGFSDSDEAPHPERLHSVRAVSDNEAVPLAVAGSRDNGVAVDVTSVRHRPSWVVVETPRTFIELEPGKFHSYLEHEGLGEVIRQRASRGHQNTAGREIYSKYAKIALSGAHRELQLLQRPVRLPIEIVPMLDGVLTIGTSLPVRVLVNGEPDAGLQLRASHRAPEDSEPSNDAIFRTDSGGCALIPIDRKGLWRLHTISMMPHADPGRADWESVWASLTFRL